VIDRKRFRPSIRPKIIGRIFSRNEYLACTAKNEKKSCFVTFHFQAIFSQESMLLVYIVNVLCMYVTVAHKSCPSTANCNCHPRKPIYSLYKFTFWRCLLPCADYLLSAEYSAAISCRIFVFGRNKKIRFRSITFINKSKLVLV
jgi:hypothetical protein